MSKLNVLVPMSGRGSRFAAANYTFPKPLIDVNGKAMIARVVENLKPTDRKDVRFIFICQKEHYENYDLYNVLKRAVGEFEMEIIQIDGITEGAACTALLASEFINNDDELMLANSDQYIDPKAIDCWYTLLDGIKSEGALLVFENNHIKWSYAKVNEDRKVIEVAEKQVISNLATTGIYWFKQGKDFVEGAMEMIKKDIRTNNEFYVCPVYNELILKDKIIEVFEIEPEEMNSLGCPEDLQVFLNKHS